jgi:primosomal protein N' (replication factor Y)
VSPPPLVEVAVPLPLPDSLVYSVPQPLAALARPGSRVRVRVGKRRLVGVILARRVEAPPGIDVRPIEEVLDAEPSLPADLLRLARFAADYYLAPIGEVVRAMLPGDLPPWGAQRVWLTSAGALSRPRDAGEAAILEALRDGGRLSLAQLQARLGEADLAERIEALRQAGRVAMSERTRRGTRYVPAVELPAGELAAQLAACGRSPAARDVVSYLAALGRPATVEELGGAVGASAAVVRRLVARGLLRQFTQAERLDLGHHELPPRSGGEPPLRLRPDQQQAVEVLETALAAGGFAAFLLAGVTGSGKTEVYLRAAAAALRQGRDAVVLVPEIALVPALARAMRERFGGRLAILHSALGPAERHQEWERVRRGEARVVLGPRSAIFAPVARLGLLVVDEEQDPAYKQETTPRYHGRDLALVRGRDAGAVTLLVSATPSLETRHNAERGKLRGLELRSRIGQGELPEGILVDLRREGPARRAGEVHFSERLRQELRDALAAGDQAIVLRNRRGYAPLLLCRACGEDMRCAQCGLPRTLHRRAGCLLCHYCGSTVAVPRRCPSCAAEALEAVGAGTERVEEEFRELFPEVPVDVLDRDAVQRRGGLAAVLEAFASGRVRVLIGTQMVSKGHHFPQVALTAVLAADSYLGFPDFRAVERTYSLLTQLAGRAGRGERPGRVVIQTYHPDHYAIQAALRHDDRGFAAEEMRFRRLFHYPPFTRMTQLLVRDKQRARAEEALAELARRLAEHPLAEGVRTLGPAPAPLERLRGQWRFQLLLRAASAGQIHRLLRAVVPAKPAYDLTIDVDPQQLL